MDQDQDPGTSSRSEDEDDSINIGFQYGSVVVAKLGSFPWWPAMIDLSPETGDIYWLDKFEDLTQKDATHYHVVFFDVPGKVTRSWVHRTKVWGYQRYFPETLTEEERKAVKNLKETASKRRLVEARSNAEAALRMPIEERRQKYSFISTFKGKITLFDDEGNKKVIDGGGVGDAEKVEPLKIRKKPGPKPKNKTSAGTLEKVAPLKIRKKPGPKPKNKSSAENPYEKVEPIKIRKKPGPKPKNRSLTESENNQSQTGVRWSSIASSTSTHPPENGASQTGVRTSSVASPISTLAPESTQSQTGGGKRRLSIASSTDSLPPDTGVSTPRKSRKTRGSSLTSSASSPPSSKPASVPRATHELAQELSVFAASYPVSESSFRPAPEGMPKRKGKKRKNSVKGQSHTGNKRGRPSETPPALENVSSCYTPTPTASNTSNSIISLQEVDNLRATASPSLLPPEVSENFHEVVLRTAADSGHSEPSENSLENQMMSTIHRLQNQMLKLNQNGKTISNLSMLKRKGKRRKSAKGHSLYGNKLGRPPKTLPAPEDVSSRDTPTPTFSDTSTRVCTPIKQTLPQSIISLQELDSLRATASPSSLPSEVPENKVEQDTEPKEVMLRLRTLADSGHSEPSENSLENQMSSTIHRIQNQTPKPNLNEKTISNLNLVVAKTEEGDIVDLTNEDLLIKEGEYIDLTGDDDEKYCQFKHGEVVFANLAGLQPWPSVVVLDPEINNCFMPEEGPPSYVHVLFLHLNRRAWVHIENVTVFDDQNYHPVEAEMLNYEKYCKAFALAQSAHSSTCEQRRHQFGNMRVVPMTGVSITSVMMKTVRAPDDCIAIL